MGGRGDGLWGGRKSIWSIKSTPGDTLGCFLGKEQRMLERGVPDLGTAGGGVTVGGRWIRLETDAEFEVPRG